MQLSREDIQWLKMIKNKQRIFNKTGRGAYYWLAIVSMLGALPMFHIAFAQGVMTRLPNGIAVLTDGLFFLFGGCCCVLLGVMWLWESVNGGISRRDRMLLSIVEKLASEEDKAAMAKR